MNTKVITEESAKIKQVSLRVSPQLNNPYPLENDYGETIGTAVLSFIGGGVDVTLFLNHATPERLDFEVDPALLDVQLYLELDPEFGVMGHVVVRRR